MTRVRFRSDMDKVFSNQNGDMVRVSPGVFEGLLSIDRPRVVRGQDHQDLAREVVFVFRDSSSRCYRYSAVLYSESAFFIPLGTPGSYAERSFEPEVEFGAYPVNRDPEAIAMRDGPPIITRFREAGIGFAAAIRKEHIDVRAYFTDHDGAEKTIFYEVPIDLLLWKNAPRLEPDDVIIGGADHVTIDGPFEAKNLAPTTCPVSVTANRQLESP